MFGNVLVNIRSFTALILVGLTLGGCVAQYSAWDDGVNNNPAEVIRKIEDGADYEGQGYNGDRMTHWAARHNQVQVLEVLLDRGLRVDRKNSSGSTPLMIAIGYQSPAAASFLIERGANVDHRNKMGFTPLYLAVQQRDPGLIDMLLGAGADPNVGGPNDVTPLHMALHQGSIEIYDKLISFGARVDAVTIQGDSSLHWAVSGGKLELVNSVLSSGLDVNIVNNRQDTALVVAVALKHPTVAKHLLDKGARQNQNIDGGTPLHFAVGIGDAETSELLLAKGANPNALDKNGWTPILIAADMRNDKMVAMLAANAVDISLSRSNGGTSAASGHILLAEGTPESKELAGDYFRLAREQYVERADALAKDARWSRAAERAGQMFGVALVGALQQQQQQAQQRQLGQIAAMSSAASSGGGYAGYHRALSEIENSSAPPDRGLPIYVEAGESDVGMRIVESKIAAAKAEKLLIVFEDNGWDENIASSLRPTEQEDFKRAPGFWSSASDELCETVVPRSIRSLAGSGKFIFRPMITMEDSYEEGLTPVHFLWEIQPQEDPGDERTARCAKAVFIAECKVAMGWIDQITTFHDQCKY